MAAYARMEDNRIQSRESSDYRYTRNSGNSVRRVEAVPQEGGQKRTRSRRNEQIVIDTQSNRERAQRVTATYVVFILAICVTLIVVGVNFLQLRAAEITYRDTIASMERELSDTKLANDNAYKRVMATVDMEEVRKIALNELNMKYAEEGQIITYNSQNGDYIRQYGEITEE